MWRFSKYWFFAICQRIEVQNLVALIPLKIKNIKNIEKGSVQCKIGQSFLSHICWNIRIMTQYVALHKLYLNAALNMKNDTIWIRHCKTTANSYSACRKNKWSIIHSRLLSTASTKEYDIMLLSTTQRVTIWYDILECSQGNLIDNDLQSIVDYRIWKPTGHCERQKTIPAGHTHNRMTGGYFMRWYVLPMIHKCQELIKSIEHCNSSYLHTDTPQSLKGRPVIAGPASPTQLLRELLEKNDWGFLRKFPSESDSTCDIFTCDIVSSYTNITHV